MKVVKSCNEDKPPAAPKFRDVPVGGVFSWNTSPATYYKISDKIIVSLSTTPILLSSVRYGEHIPGSFIGDSDVNVTIFPNARVVLE